MHEDKGKKGDLLPSICFLNFYKSRQTRIEDFVNDAFKCELYIKGREKGLLKIYHWYKA